MKPETTPDLVDKLRIYADSCRVLSHDGAAHAFEMAIDEIKRLREFEWKYTELLK